MAEAKVQHKERPLGALIDLRRVRLEHCEATFHGINAGDQPKALDVEMQVGCLKSPDQSQHLRALVVIRVVARPEEGSERTICSIHVRYALDYFVDDVTRFDSIKEQDPDLQPVMQTALHNVWPYARELAQSMSARMGIPPIILQSLRVLPGGVQIGGGRLKASETALPSTGQASKTE